MIDEINDRFIKNHFYAKNGHDYPVNHTYIRQEVEKDVELIKRGDHPHIGYVERVGQYPKTKITDAWWM